MPEAAVKKKETADSFDNLVSKLSEIRNKLAKDESLTKQDLGYLANLKPPKPQELDDNQRKTLWKLLKSIEPKTEDNSSMVMQRSHILDLLAIYGFVPRKEKTIDTSSSLRLTLEPPEFFAPSTTALRYASVAKKGTAVCDAKSIPFAEAGDYGVVKVDDFAFQTLTFIHGQGCKEIDEKQRVALGNSLANMLRKDPSRLRSDLGMDDKKLEEFFTQLENGNPDAFKLLGDKSRLGRYVGVIQNNSVIVDQKSRTGHIRFLDWKIELELGGEMEKVEDFIKGSNRWGHALYNLGLVGRHAIFDYESQQLAGPLGMETKVAGSEKKESVSLYGRGAYGAVARGMFFTPKKLAIKWDARVSEDGAELFLVPFVRATRGIAVEGVPLRTPELPGIGVILETGFGARTQWFTKLGQDEGVNLAKNDFGLTALVGMRLQGEKLGTSFQAWPAYDVVRFLNGDITDKQKAFGVELRLNSDFKPGEHGSLYVIGKYNIGNFVKYAGAEVGGRLRHFGLVDLVEAGLGYYYYFPTSERDKQPVDVIGVNLTLRLREESGGRK